MTRHLLANFSYTTIWGELPFYSTEIWGNLKFGSETLLKRPRAVAALRGQLKLKQNQATFLIAYGGKPALASGLELLKIISCHFEVSRENTGKNFG